MNFTDVKDLTILEGEVMKITRKSDGVVLWEAVSYTNLVPTAKNPDGTVLDGIGYRRKAFWNTVNFGSHDSFTAIGNIPFGDGTKAHDIYVYGLNFSGSSYNRFYVADSSYVQLNGATSIMDGFSNSVVTVTKIANNYWKLTTPAYSTKVKYFCMSGVTVDGITPIVTIDEPII